MAIKKELERTKNDNYYPYPDSYLRIDSVQLKTNAYGNQNEEVWIHINIWSDKTARDTIKDPDLMKWASSIAKDVVKTSIAEFQPFVTEFSKDALVAGAYAYIKTLDKYKGGDDV